MQGAIKPDEARAIAKDAYIYGYPLVDSYRILYPYFVDRSSPEYKAAWNEKVANNARVFTPADVAMGTPNADTPYSHRPARNGSRTGRRRRTGRSYSCCACTGRRSKR